MAKIFYTIFCFLFFSSLYSHAFADVDYYLDKPYVINPLGEGSEALYSKGPLFRDDAFDCTTYVEAVLSQYKTLENNEDFMQNLLLLRYINGEVDFFKRAHFMEFQWIPNALRHEFIKEYPLKNAQESKIEMDMETWFLQNNAVKNKDIAYKAKAQNETSIQYSFPYVPIDEVNASFVKSLPQTMVVFFLRELPKNTIAGQKARQNHITHMGIIKEGELYHASSKAKKVVRVSLLDYLASNPSCKGIALYLIP